MQICIGLDLGIEYGEPLFQKAGYILEGSEVLIAYKGILLSCRGYTVYECNEILGLLSLPLLAKKVIE